jgi:hypothetical protein
MQMPLECCCAGELLTDASYIDSTAVLAPTAAPHTMLHALPDVAADVVQQAAQPTLIDLRRKGNIVRCSDCANLVNLRSGRWTHSLMTLQPTCTMYGSLLSCAFLRRRMLNTDGTHPNLQRVCVPESRHPGVPPHLLLMATQNIGKGNELLL